MPGCNVRYSDSDVPTAQNGAESGWPVQPFSRYQPITPMVNAVRALLTGSSSDVGLALAWSGLLVLTCTPVAVLRYRRA